jgi:hypothetical protein
LPFFKIIRFSFARDKFRARKKELKAKAEKDKVLLAKNSLDGSSMTLVDECPEDVRLAQLLSIQVTATNQLFRCQVTASK